MLGGIFVVRGPVCQTDQKNRYQCQIQGAFSLLRPDLACFIDTPIWIRACCRSVKMEKQDRKCPHQQATNNEKEPQQFHYNRDPDLNVHFSTSMASVLSLLTIETEPQSQEGKKTINR